MTLNFLVATFPPFTNLNIHLPDGSSDYADEARIIEHVAARNAILGDLLERGEIHISRRTDEGCTLAPLMLGGKGGFGSQLRAAGGRMSSRKTGNNASCRDLNGRRLSTVKEAQKLAEYIENEDTRKKAAADARKEKLEKLERQIQAADVDENGETSSGKKRRLEDTEYVEQSKELVEGVRSAVAAGLLRKKKKAKTDTQTGAKTEKAASSSAPAPTTSSSSSAVVESPRVAATA